MLLVKTEAMVLTFTKVWRHVSDNGIRMSMVHIEEYMTQLCNSHFLLRLL